MGGWLTSLLRSSEQQEAIELTDQVAASGAEAIGECRRGERVHVCGTIRSVTLRPRANAPTLEAEIYDGTGHLTLVWLGRRRLSGVEVGRTIQAVGRVTCPDGQPMMYNPEYDLRVVAAHD